MVNRVGIYNYKDRTVCVCLKRHTGTYRVLRELPMGNVKRGDDGRDYIEYNLKRDLKRKVYIETLENDIYFNELIESIMIKEENSLI